MSTFIDNPDGSRTITAHARKVRISAGEMGLHRMFKTEPKPIECFSCRAPAMYRANQRRVGEELALIDYVCGECGTRETEPLD